MRTTTGSSLRGLVHAATAGAVMLFGTACDNDDARITETNASNSIAQLASASGSSLPHINNTNFLIPTSVSADLAAYDCSNNPGPQITFSGLTALGGWGVEMDFTNNLKGTHQYTAENTVQATALAAGEEITVPKQPVLGGVGGNPFIWVQWINGDGSAASSEMFVGRCVQGAGWKVRGPSSMNSAIWANFEVTDCANSPGPFINLGSGMALAGLTARIIFRNNDNPVGGPHETDVVRRDIVMVEPGMSFTFPKQPVLGGVGGNPWIFAGFEDGNGRSLGAKTMVGRCEQLSKAL